MYTSQNLRDYVSHYASGKRSGVRWARVFAVSLPTLKNVQANKIEHQSKAIFAIEFLPPVETYIVRKEEDKWRKYQDLFC